MTDHNAADLISIPQGGGALAALGETFQPDLHTGTGNFSVPLGRAGFRDAALALAAPASPDGPSWPPPADELRARALRARAQALETAPGSGSPRAPLVAAGEVRADDLPANLADPFVEQPALMVVRSGTASEEFVIDHLHRGGAGALAAPASAKTLAGIVSTRTGAGAAWRQLTGAQAPPDRNLAARDDRRPRDGQGVHRRRRARSRPGDRLRRELSRRDDVMRASS